jgi:hypothetical protein
MKKRLIMLVAFLVLLVAVVLGYFIMRAATEDEADALIARLMANAPVEMQYERAYLNPILGALYVENMRFDSANLSIAGAKIVYNDDELNPVATIDLRDIVGSNGSEYAYLRIDSLRLSDIRLHRDADYVWVVDSIDGIRINGLDMGTNDAKLRIGELSESGRIEIPENYDMFQLLVDADRNIQLEDVSLTGSAGEPLEIDSITYSFKLAEVSFVQAFAIKDDSFNLTLNTNGFLKNSDVYLTKFEADYTDRALFDTVIRTLEENLEQKGLRAELISKIEGIDLNYALDSSVLRELLVEFVNNPQRISLNLQTTNDRAILLDLDSAMYGRILTEHGAILTVNSKPAYQFKQDPSYHHRDVLAVGGMVVKFVSVSGDWMDCLLANNESGEEQIFYCTSEDIEYFVDNTGPFYIEYNADRNIIYKTTDWQRYEDWANEYHEELVSDVAGGLHLDYIDSEYDAEYAEYQCIFTSHTDATEHILYCDAFDIEYFEERDGPFYVEFNYNDAVSGYSDNWQEYEEWYSKNY